MRPSLPKTADLCLSICALAELSELLSKCHSTVNKHFYARVVRKFVAKMMKDIGEEAAAVVQPNMETAERETATVDLSNCATKLAEGLLVIYQPQLEGVKKELDELTRKQESMIDRMGVENQKLEEIFADTALNEMLSTIKTYQGKLSSIKKEMGAIHERTFKLKKRALRLQQIKQKEALSRVHRREQEIRREQELIGKPLSPA